MGTVHRESRSRLETLRMCDAITDVEWLCMSRALETLDQEFTARCKAGSVDYDQIAGVQQTRYRACTGNAAPMTIECSLLSTDRTCITERCAVAASD